MARIVNSILLLAVVTFWGCRKNAVADSIEGVWELRSASGMITIQYPPNNGNTFEFSGPNYKRFVNGASGGTGTYQLIRDLTVKKETCLEFPDGRFENRIEFSGIYQPKTFVEIANDTMKLVSGCFASDGGSLRTYVRKFLPD